MRIARATGGLNAERVPLWKRVVRCWPLYAMLAPAIVYYILICYVPIAGNVLAFKDYSFRKAFGAAAGLGFSTSGRFSRATTAGA